MNVCRKYAKDQHRIRRDTGVAKCNKEIWHQDHLRTDPCNSWAHSGCRKTAWKFHMCRLCLQPAGLVPQCQGLSFQHVTTNTWKAMIQIRVWSEDCLLTWKSSMRCSVRLELGFGTRKTRNSARKRLVLFFSAEDTLKRKTLEVIPLGQKVNSSRKEQRNLS